MKQKISVTAEDIQNGTPECEVSCPVALAVRRAFPEALDICVDGFEIRVGDVSVKTPEAVSVFIADFDYEEDEDVKPFEFEIDLNP